MKNVVDLHMDREKARTIVGVGDVYIDRNNVTYEVLHIAEDVTRPQAFKIVYRRNRRVFVVPVELFEQAINDGDLDFVRERE